jgi:uncharacterized protein (TIGR02147 family)
MVLEHENYRSFLKSVLAEKKRRNSAYSMRALAQHVGITQAGLSQVLSSKRNLSPAKALQIAEKLGLGAEEAEYFCLLVQFESTKDHQLREAVERRLLKIHPARKSTDLSGEVFRMISDPYHYTILLLTKVKGFEFKPARIARRLGINRYDLDAAIARLIKLDLLEESPPGSGRYRETNDDLQFHSEIPNQALRSYHRQMLTKAIESLETQTPQEKVMSSEQVVLAKEDLNEARKLAKEFYARIAELSKRAGPKTDVYNVGVQVFSLTHERKS